MRLAIFMRIACDPECWKSVAPQSTQSELKGLWMTIRRESMREELKSSREKKCKARTVVGRGEEEPAIRPRI